MGLKEEYARRALWALWRLQKADWPGEIGLSQTKLGMRVAELVGRAVPFTQATVRGWLEGSVPREFETRKALADALGVDEIWLYFNRGDPPPGWLEFLDEARYRAGLQEAAAEEKLRAREEEELEAEQLLNRRRRSPVAKRPPVAKTPVSSQRNRPQAKPKTKGGQGG